MKVELSTFIALWIGFFIALVLFGILAKAAALLIMWLWANEGVILLTFVGLISVSGIAAYFVAYDDRNL